MRHIRTVAFTLVWFLFSSAQAQLSLPAIFSDHMVLQRSKNVPIWGKAQPNEDISITLADRHANVRAGADGSWKATLDLSEAAAGPHALLIDASRRLEIKDVLVGEVWLCSGQSNMSYELKHARGGAEEIKAAARPKVRLFKVEVDPSLYPASNCRGKWEVCSPDIAKEFSAIGYYFGSRINRELNVPVGVIQAALGGTGAELWTSGDTIAREPELKPLSDWLNDIRKRAKNWDAAARHEELREEIWTAPDYDDSCWLQMQLPQPWPNAGYLMPPPVIYRTDITLPDEWVGHELILSLGPITNWDETFVNGTRVGKTENSQAPRIYRVPATVVRGKRLVIAMRISAGLTGFSGFNGRAEEMSLTRADAPDVSPISLAIPWRFTALKGNGYIPSALFNGMIHPLIPFAIKGVIWYQGESNGGWFFTPNRPEQWPLSPYYGVDRARQYRTLFPAMIRDWRARWNQGDFPFLFVQLPVIAQPGHVQAPGLRHDWSEIAEAQTYALKLSNTFMTVNIDIGGELHPPNKIDFARRLEDLALTRVYGKTFPADYPMFESLTIDNDKACVRFTNAPGGLVTKEGTDVVGSASLKCFAIAGEDQRWFWADAKIQGDTVVVWSASVSKPVHVRYAFPPVGVLTLYNQAGLPAAPFRTDGADPQDVKSEKR